MKQTTTLLVAAFAALSIASCKKDKKTTTLDPEPVLNCDLASEIIETNDTSVYEYDSENRLIRETSNGQLSYTVEYLENGDVKETSSTAMTTFRLNAQGFPVSTVTEHNTGNKTKTFYFYDANNYIVRMINQNLTAQDSILAEDSIVITNTVANGNLIHQVMVGIINVELAFTHDFNRPNNLPEPRKYSTTFLGGGRVDKNLMLTGTAIGNTNETTEFSYLYDSKGRVIRRIGTSYSTPVDRDTTYYKYRCD